MTTSMARKMDSFLIADTRGLVSLVVRTDSNHESAVAAALTQASAVRADTVLHHFVLTE